jgi:hypothetical protein
MLRRTVRHEVNEAANRGTRQIDRGSLLRCRDPAELGASASAVRVRMSAPGRETTTTVGFVAGGGARPEPPGAGRLQRLQPDISELHLHRRSDVHLEA